MPIQALAPALASMLGPALPGGLITATATASQHYALYTATGGAVSLIGGNELGPAGAPGTFSWSVAESFSFTPGDTLYVVAWGGGSASQGLLAQFESAAGTFRTGDAGWLVYQTDAPMGDGSPWPSPAQVAAWAAGADAGGAWKAPYVGPRNVGSTDPWGKIDGIHTHARWTWAPLADGGNPLTAAGAGAHAVVFRYALAVPSGGTASALALGGCVGLWGWRRRAR